MTQAATTARPANAAIAWATKDAIFVEYPVKGGGPPYIVRYHKTAAGLAAALNILIENSAPAAQSPANHPAIKRKGAGSAAQQELAADVVRRMFVRRA